MEVTLYKESSVACNAIAAFCDFDAVEPAMPSIPATSAVLPFEAVMRKVRPFSVVIIVMFEVLHFMLSLSCIGLAVFHEFT